MGIFSSIKDNLSHAYSVIAREADSGEYPIWRHPEENFRTGSILDVGEDDVALFYASGRITGDGLSGGRFPLKTSNYPFLDNLRSAFSGGENSYKCRIFFINTKPMTNLRWGTQNPIPGNFTIANPWPGKPPFSITADIQSYGSYTVKIVNPKLFIQKWKGTSTDIDGRSRDALNSEVIRPMVIGRVTDKLVESIQEYENGIWEIQKHKTEISSRLEEMLDESFAEWGMRLSNFYIESISVVESDEWKRIKAAYTSFSAVQMEKAGDALGAAQELDALGNNWQRIQARNIMQTMAENPGAGGVAATGAGLGMGMVAGGVMGSMAASMFSPMQEAPLGTGSESPGMGGGGVSRFAPKPRGENAPEPTPHAGAHCPACGAAVAGGKFCPECGAQLQQNRTCPVCGLEIAPSAKFCPECGSKIQQG